MISDAERLAATIAGCRICVERPRATPLPHEPRPVLRIGGSARILIASQAPGTKAHAGGLPFKDASGDRLRDWLGVCEAEFYDRRNFAIVPMGFCFPGQDRHGGDLPPRRECAPAWRAEVLATLPNARLVLAIGLYAQAWHLGATRQASLTDTVRNWRRTMADDGVPVMPLPHPSWRNTGWIRRNPWFETELLPVLKLEIRHIVSAGN